MEGNPYHPEDDIWIQFESPERGYSPPELSYGSDLEAARRFIAENPGWRLEHWRATPQEVHWHNEGQNTCHL
jgi:hypothetical protein